MIEPGSKTPSLYISKASWVERQILYTSFCYNIWQLYYFQWCIIETNYAKIIGQSDEKQKTVTKKAVKNNLPAYHSSTSWQRQSPVHRRLYGTLNDNRKMMTTVKQLLVTEKPCSLKWQASPKWNDFSLLSLSGINFMAVSFNLSSAQVLNF